MPKIPTLQAQNVIESPKLSPGVASQPYSALARAGEELSQTSQYSMRAFTAIKEAERKVKASEIEAQMRNDLEDAAASFRMRTDFANFDKDTAQFTKDALAKAKAAAGDDEVLQTAIDTAFKVKAGDFNRAIQAKKAEGITNRGRGQMQSLINQSLQDYAKETTEEGRQTIRDKITATANSFAESRIISFKEAEDYVNAFANSSEDVRADQWTDVDAPSALVALKSGHFNFSPKITQDKIEKATKRVESDERERMQEDDRLEKRMDKIRKKVIDNNELSMWKRFYDGTLKERELDVLAENGMIGETAYKGLKEKLRKLEKEENNPIIVGDIAAMIELRDLGKAEVMLKDALNRGNIKTETYINMRKAIADKSYGDAVGFINKAMQPSELELDFYKKQKHADAIADLSVRAAAGENPIEAAKDIVRLNRTSQVTSFNRYRNPRFLDGKKDDPEAIQTAKTVTLQAFNSNAISAEEYKTEMDLIANIELALSELERSRTSEVDLDELKKKMKVGK